MGGPDFSPKRFGRGDVFVAHHDIEMVGSRHPELSDPDFRIAGAILVRTVHCNLHRFILIVNDGGGKAGTCRQVMQCQRA